MGLLAEGKVSLQTDLMCRASETGRLSADACAV